MILHELSFCKIIILNEDMVEVIVDDGVDMTLQMVDEYHSFLLTQFDKSFSVFVNKLNSYSYSLNAQKKLGTLKEINAIAVLCYTRASEIITENVIAFPRDISWNAKIYDNRTDALNWLMSENAKIENLN